MGGDGGYTPQAFTDTDESLSIDQQKEATVTIEELSKIQTHLPVQMKYVAEKSMNAIFDQIDADVIGTATTGANSVIDDGTFNGTAGNGLTITPANVANIFTMADTFLRLNNVRYNTMAKFTGKVKVDAKEKMGVAIISPYVHQALLLYLGSKTSKLGDEVSIKGYSTFFSNFNVFVSNNIQWSGQLVLSTNWTAGDTFTINGVTFTAATTPTNAGDINVGTNATTNLANIIVALNALGTTIANTSTTGYVHISTANQALLTNLTASLVATNILKVVMNGYGNVIVSQSMTAGGNVWTTTQQKQHNLFGVNNSISVAMQKEPGLYINPVSQKVAKDYVTWTSYGRKVFNDQKFQLIDVQVNTSGFLTAPTSITY